MGTFRTEALVTLIRGDCSHSKQLYL